jgi:integrase/transcriptional regulator with XRE-family HTH domain
VRPKNKRVVGTPEERKRVGEELQRLRNAEHWSQEETAEKATMSIGSLQAIEYNKWDVSLAKIERYAALFGTTADQLLNPDVVQPSDPKWRGLNEEHLAVARQYAMALKIKRTAVELLLVDDLASDWNLDRTRGCGERASSGSETLGAMGRRVGVLGVRGTFRAGASRTNYQDQDKMTTQRRTRVAPGIYQDAHGFSVMASVGSGGRRISSHEIRYPPETPLPTMVARWHHEKMRLTDALAKAGDGPVSRGTLAADVRRYLATAKLTPRRRQEREQQLKWWCEQRDGGPPFGGRLRSSLETPSIRRALAGLLMGGAASSTVNKYRHALSHVYTVLDGKSAPNPIYEAPKYEEPEAAMRDQPYWAIQLIIDAIRDTGQRADRSSLTKARIRVLAYAPITPMQLRQIRRTDIDWTATPPTIITPGRKKGHGTTPRLLPLTTQGLEAFRAFDAADGWEIRFSRSSLHRTFTAARDRVVETLREERPDLDVSRLAKMRPYDLRHSFATMVYKATGDLAITGEFLGHAPGGKTTRRYAQGALPAHVEKAGEKVILAFSAPTAATVPPRLVKKRTKKKETR